MQELPTLERTAEAEQTIEDFDPGMAVKPIGTPDCSTHNIAVPMTHQTYGYVRRRHDVLLTRGQAEKLKRVTDALGQREARLENGKIIDRGSDTIRWLLENIE